MGATGSAEVEEEEKSLPRQKKAGPSAPPLLPIANKRAAVLEPKTKKRATILDPEDDVDRSSPSLANPNVVMFDGGATCRAKDSNAQMVFQQPGAQLFAPALPAQMVPQASSPLVYRPRRPCVQWQSPVAAVYEVSPVCSSPYSPYSPQSPSAQSPPAAAMPAAAGFQVQQQQLALHAAAPLQQQQQIAAAPPAQLPSFYLHPAAMTLPAAYPAAAAQGAAQVQMPVPTPVLYRTVGQGQQHVQQLYRG
eukprot:TRINITY_DN3832_c0_g2_i1.p1 TRINITY_DN3832_c0_g2~~TRINITY_DN3832_c0_g2_i1.p1  ORF type:complete len:249 (-),score=60.10 TRINITY_DN3832_c0_g2_i1:59-805(-)